ncbi:MAG: 16S rRNA (cytosine(1402)-N(4))-methyltransferase RsmH [Dehalococcoidia bacterium]|jgi:16S rRNA (cytosine1402-N4)-methyltransferase|nr:16S rRNA (cytosine(1402)-N(4))-methyltransferase RsmH [Dehalococcoidia bacterium]
MAVTYHVPVLTREVIEGLRVKIGSSYIDCNVGEGGHSQAILEASSPEGQLLGIDLDPQALETAGENLQIFLDRVVLVNDNFSNLRGIANGQEFYSVDGILFDLGLSSLQLEGEGRGFSFRAEEPLDMRFDPRQEITAWDVVNHYSRNDLTRIIRTYGEEYRADRIVKEVLENRPIDTSLHLAKVVSRAVRSAWGRTHPATRTFQAIRMEVNGELANLELALGQAISLLERSGRLVVISYHSLEDRLVKTFFRQESREVKSIRLINKKVISPSREEVQTNHRSRSARMRVAERI